VLEVLLCPEDGQTVGVPPNCCTCLQNYTASYPNDRNFHNRHHGHLTAHSSMTVLYSLHNEIRFRYLLHSHTHTHTFQGSVSCDKTIGCGIRHKHINITEFLVSNIINMYTILYYKHLYSYKSVLVSITGHARNSMTE
jgi:hypothetical protein